MARFIQKQWLDHLTTSRKVMLIFNFRQSLKTIFVKHIGEISGLNVLCLSALFSKIANMQMQNDLKLLPDLTEGYQILKINKAQKVLENDLVLKILSHEMPQLKMVLVFYYTICDFN
jgi:hypothetical protein